MIEPIGTCACVGEDMSSVLICQSDFAYANMAIYSCMPRHGQPSAIIVGIHLQRLSDLPPEELLAVARFRGEGDERRFWRKADLLADPAPPVREIIPRHLVRLRQVDEETDAVELQPLHELQVLPRRIPPDVENHDHEPQGVALPEVGLDHRPPLFPDRLGDLRIPVSGQIDEGEPVVDAEEIDPLRPARGIAGPGQPPTVQEGVDEGGFSHVGSSGKGDLGKPGGRIMDRFFRGEHKLGG